MCGSTLYCQTLCLGARPRYNLVVDEDVKKASKQTNKQARINFIGTIAAPINFIATFPTRINVIGTLADRLSFMESYLLVSLFIATTA